MSSQGGTNAILAALAANLGIAVTKFVAFLLTRSSSMLAESIHSLADSGNQVLLLVGGKQANRRAATAEHPFGYGRSAVPVRASSSRSCCSAWAACSRCTRRGTSGRTRTRSSPWHWVPLLVLLVLAIGLESFSFRTAIVESNRGPRAAQLGPVRPGAPRRRSCRWCCWRTSRALLGLVLRAVRRLDDAAHRRRPLGRRRHRHDRRPAGGGGGRARDRDELAAARRGRPTREDVARDPRRRCWARASTA